jgi:hypothetical protein
MIIGARRDAIFGPTIMAGLADLRRGDEGRRLPGPSLDRKEIQTMLKEVRSYPFSWESGEGMKDMDKLVDAIIKVGASSASARASRISRSIPWSSTKREWGPRR